MVEILHFVHIQAPVSIVYKAIASEEGLRSWWTEETIAPNKEGAIAEFKFGDMYHDKMKIIKLEPNKKVEWLCIEGDVQWIGTVFLFDLEDKGEKTILRFRHGNWREATDFFAECNYHWGYYLRSLKLYCETGKGTPFSNASR
jgi:uncharacterized protein YndB with AHSA1/START domain